MGGAERRIAALGGPDFRIRAELAVQTGALDWSLGLEPPMPANTTPSMIRKAFGDPTPRPGPWAHSRRGFAPPCIFLARQRSACSNRPGLRTWRLGLGDCWKIAHWYSEG